MTDVSNAQLYQEFRKTQRRMVAAAAAVLSGVGGGLWLIEPIASAPPVAAAVFLLLFADYLRNGRLSKVFKWLNEDTVKTERELESELGPPYEPVEYSAVSGGIRDLVIGDDP